MRRGAEVASVLVLAGAAFLTPTLLQSQGVKADARGCNDSPLLSRVSGCAIYSCERSDWDAAKIPVGPNGTIQIVQGEKLHIYYDCLSESYSRLKVVRNAETALRRAGYSIEFSGTYDGDPGLTARKGAQ